ncbi:MAG: NUDIX hydrolase [Candidatus Dojkabacteria bacterium]
MKPGEIPQSYRASVAAIFVNKNKEFFLVQQPGFRENEWDFIKGGMIQDEEEEDTLKRELREELGNDIKYKILRRSVWNIIYSWPKEHQIKKGFRGQARVSFWVKYIDGELIPGKQELTATKWFNSNEMEKVLRDSNTGEHDIKIFLEEWEKIQKEFESEF